MFHPGSYGYRPKRSALDAVASCRQRYFRKDWVVDLDIAKVLRHRRPRIDGQRRFGPIPTRIGWCCMCGGGLRLRCNCPDGTQEVRDRGTPQGALCSAEHNPPCGVPVTCPRTTPSLITPARSIARSSLSTDWSLTRSSIACINRSCGIASKQLAISVSTTHRRPRHASSTRTCSPSWPTVLGRNPTSTRACPPRRSARARS